MTHIRTSDQKGIFNLGINDYTCNWGAHICGFYKTPEERDEIVFNYVHAGNVPTDFVLIAVEPDEQATFAKRILNFFPEDRTFIEDGKQCMLSPNQDLYYPNGTFDPWEMEIALTKTYQEVLRKGYQNTRGVADMIWAKKAIPGKKWLMAYEARLNLFIKGKNWASFCLYDITRFSGEIIIQALQTHPFVMNAGKLTENQYYIKPETWLQENAPEFLTPHRHN